MEERTGDERRENTTGRQLWRRLVALNKTLLVAVILFVVTEFLCVVSLFSSEWITSNNIGMLCFDDTVEY